MRMFINTDSTCYILFYLFYLYPSYSYMEVIVTATRQGVETLRTAASLGRSETSDRYVLVMIVRSGCSAGSVRCGPKGKSADVRCLMWSCPRYGVSSRHPRGPSRLSTFKHENEESIQCVSDEAAGAVARGAGLAPARARGTAGRR